MAQTSWAIVGASRGFGLEHIRQLSAKPENLVFALVRNKATLTELNDLAASRPNIHVVTADLNSLPLLQEAAKSVAAVTGGSLDILINNGAYLDTKAAGLLPSQLSDPEFAETAKDAIEKSVESNVLGAIHATNVFLPLIEKGTQKKIIHISTGMTDRELTIKTGIPLSFPYAGSKAMLNDLVVRYGVELQPKGIHVVGLSPGFVETSEMPEQLLSFLVSAFQKADPTVQGRIRPEDSVRMQLETIRNLGWESQGRLISHHGDENWF